LPSVKSRSAAVISVPSQPNGSTGRPHFSTGVASNQPAPSPATCRAGVKKLTPPGFPGGVRNEVTLRLDDTVAGGLVQELSIDGYAPGVSP
jgi:hypothetical protein